MLVMSLSAPLAAFAAVPADFSDFPTGWSREAMVAAVENDLLQGYNGQISPEANLTRAEMAAILVRAFGATQKHADLSGFVDVDPDAWYYEEMSVAVGVGFFIGDDEAGLRPEDDITREQVALVLARAFYLLNLDDDAADTIAPFTDADSVSTWALPGVAGLVRAGRMNGYEDKTLRPLNLITREEFAQLMYNLVAKYITEPGEYTFNIDGNVIIRVPGVILKNCRINGDLYLGHNLDLEDATFDNTRLNGRLIVCKDGTIIIGGGETPLPGLDQPIPGGPAEIPPTAGPTATPAPSPTTGGGGGGTNPPITTYAFDITVQGTSMSGTTDTETGIPGTELFHPAMLRHIKSNGTGLKDQMTSSDPIKAGVFASMFSVLEGDLTLDMLGTVSEFRKYVTVASGSAVSEDVFYRMYLTFADMVGTTTLLIDDPEYMSGRVDLVVGTGASGLYTLQISMQFDSAPMSFSGPPDPTEMVFFDAILDRLTQKMSEASTRYGMTQVQADSYEKVLRDRIDELTGDRWTAWVNTNVSGVGSSDPARLASNKFIKVGELGPCSYRIQYAGAIITATIR
jgi:hypothetical protein